MKHVARPKLLVAIAVALIALGCLAWFFMPGGREAARAIGSRLMGQDSRGVEAVLGPPTYRDNGANTWHYMDEMLVGRFADKSVADKTLVVQFDHDGWVSNVYLRD
jgi:outer membrane protein assembly factor BamE (lipoprotein component of BamABCDE complex)